MGLKPNRLTMSNSRLVRICPHSYIRHFSVRRFLADEQASEPGTNNPKLIRSARRKQYRFQQTVFSGIQPTGIPHLGNYLGALRQWKHLQDEAVKDPAKYRLIFSIVDLHALTHPQTASDLALQRKQTFASLLAIGLDPELSLIYYQSEVAAHTQLMWYLSNVASTGYLSRMTQWKSKMGVSADATLEDQAAREKLRLGLFSYPVLQAADILLYGARIVPVGEDQVQHVEFARQMAKSFNAQYPTKLGRDFFHLPEPLVSPAKRIMSLKNPASKMSKSDPDPNSRILITDSADEIHKKFRGALTDSTTGITYDPENRPGVSNLVQILKYTSGQEASFDEIAANVGNLSMKDFKEHVADETIKLLAGIRGRYEQLMDPNNSELDRLRRKSADVVRAIAGVRIAKIEGILGLKPPLENKRFEDKSAGEKKEAIMREQEQAEADNVSEPDVTPQKDQGVDIPIAS